MATKKPDKAAADTQQALALLDIPAQSVKAGCVFSAPVAVVAALVAEGAADTHPAAIDHAQKREA